MSDLRPIDILTVEIAIEVTGVVGVSPALWYFRYIASIFLTLHKRLCFMCSLHVIHGVGSNQFLSVNIGVIRLLSVITTTPFGNYGTSEKMFDQKRWKKIKNIGKILPILSFTEQ